MEALSHKNELCSDETNSNTSIIPKEMCGAYHQKKQHGGFSVARTGPFFKVDRIRDSYKCQLQCKTFKCLLVS